MAAGIDPARLGAPCLQKLGFDKSEEGGPQFSRHVRKPLTLRHKKNVREERNTKKDTQQEQSREDKCRCRYMHYHCARGVQYWKELSRSDCNCTFKLNCGNKMARDCAWQDKRRTRRSMKTELQCTYEHFRLRFARWIIEIFS